MAYMDEQAEERARVRQQMLGSQQPQAIGRADPESPQPQGVQLPTNLQDMLAAVQQFLAQSAAPKGIKVDQQKNLEVPMMIPTRPGAPEPERWRGDDIDLGGAISAMFDKAKGSALQDMLRRSQPPAADVRDRSVTGAAERAQRVRDATPGPYAKGEAATKYVQEKIPGLKPGIPTPPPTAEGAPTAPPSEPAARAYLEQQKGGGAIRMTEKGSTPPATGDRILPGTDLKGVDPRIAEIIGAAAEGLPEGYKVRPTSGTRTEGQGQHTKGKAVDWEIVGPDGKAISNRGDDTTGLYTKLAQNAYGYQEQHHPDLTGQFQWGGQFGTSKNNPNEPDLMHFDIGGRRGRIAKYSRETIGTAIPPAPGGAPQTPQTPPWDKGLPVADAKTNWPDPSQTTPAAQLPQPQVSAAAPAATPPTTAAPAAHTPGVPPELSKLVMSKEWFVPNPVDDYGRRTIGYGTDARGRTSITEPEARAEMNAQLQQHLNKIDANFPNLPPGVRNSVASLTFNVGDGWMSEKGNGLAAALKAGNMPAAKQEFMRYVHVHDAAGNKSVLPGLVNRRTDEARAFDGQQPLYTKNPDAPAGSQPDVAPPTATVEKPPVPALETAVETMKERTDTAPLAPSAPSAPSAPAVAEQPDTAREAAQVIAPKEPSPADVFAGDVPVPTEGQPTAAAPAPALAVPAVAPPVAAPPSPPPAAVKPAAPPPVATAPPPPPPRPAPPQASAPAAPVTPPVKQQTGLDRAHALLDMTAGEFVKKFAPEHLGKVKSFGYENTPMREMVQKPFVGSQIVDGLAPHMQKNGFTMQDFQKAMTQPSPLGKRSEGVPALTPDDVQRVGFFNDLKDRFSPPLTADEFKKLSVERPDISNMPRVDRYSSEGRDVPAKMPEIRDSGEPLSRVPFGTPEYPLRELDSGHTRIEYGPPLLPEEPETGTSTATDFSGRARTPMAPPGLDGKSAPMPTQIERDNMEVHDRLRFNLDAEKAGRPERLPLHGSAPGRPDLPPEAGPGQLKTVPQEETSLPDLPMAPPGLDRRSTIEDRRGDPGGARQVLGRKVGIQQPVEVDKYWAQDARPVPDNELTRALGGDDLARYEAAHPEGEAVRGARDIRTVLPPAVQVPPQTPQPPQMTPSLADALVESVQDQGRPPINMRPDPAALPVLPATAVAPPAPGMPGGLSLAPPGLDLASPGAGPFQTALGVPGSQGGAIATLGMLPQIQNATFSTPLIEQQARQPTVGQGSLSPIPWQTLGGWGWGGSSGPSAGIGDFGGGGFGGFGGGGGLMGGGGGMFPMPITWGG